MRILVRTSQWAIWARRIGSFAIPLAIIPVFMHRGGVIGSGVFEVTEAVAVGFALLAFILSVGAFARIWTTGDRGWGRAVTGLLLSLVCLAPVGYGAVEAIKYPMVGDISTDLANPPPIISSLVAAPVSATDVQKVANAFPNVKTRRYPLGATRAYDLVSKLIDERGWEVKLRRQPLNPYDSGQVNALATTLLGWRDEVSLRIDGDPQGVSVAMRMVALSQVHEPGVEGRRVEEFLTALDAKVTILMRDEPVGASGDTETDNSSQDRPVVPAPAPARPPKK
jgi:hypothetical protein